MKSKYLFLSLFLLMLISCKNEKEVIYDEADVPAYKLPELFIAGNGESINSFAAWKHTRKPEILELFSEEMYGRMPNTEYTIEFHEKVLADNYLNGHALVKEISAYISTVNGTDSFNILYIFPLGKKNVPVFAGLNFKGNHTIDTLSSITVPSAWVENDNSLGISNNLALPQNRGARASRWPIQTIIDRGYGLATVYYGEFDPDYDDGFQNGFHPLFATAGKTRDKSSPGSISIWAKGLSLIADYLEQDSIADPDRIIVIGHSRLGKAALWSAANDDRFSAVISNCSGCGGAALSMRSFGETVESINNSFPHWFCEEFKRYNGKERKLPLDQHMLLAMMAPRPLYVASATKDQWADPMGEFLSLKKASEVYKLYGISQTFPDIFPAPDMPYDGITGYHIRSGRHDITAYDWITYLNWCDKWLVD